MTSEEEELYPAGQIRKGRKPFILMRMETWLSNGKPSSWRASVGPSDTGRKWVFALGRQPMPFFPLKNNRNRSYRSCMIREKREVRASPKRCPSIGKHFSMALLHGFWEETLVSRLFFQGHLHSKQCFSSEHREELLVVLENRACLLSIINDLVRFPNSGVLSWNVTHCMCRCIWRKYVDTHDVRCATINKVLSLN